MDYSKIAYKIASWSFMLVGVGHTTTYLLSPKTPEQIDFIQKMKDFSINMMETEISIFEFYHGFSLLMGVLLFSFGLLNFCIIRNKKEGNVATNILLVNIFVALVCAILSIQYFFAAPIAFTSIAFLGFTISLFKRKAIL